MGDTENLQLLTEEIKAIKETLDEAKLAGRKLNEAETELIIIDPILRRLGYSPLEISKRSHDSVAGNFPDYTLLAGKPQQWFLEGKKLDMSLQDGEAAQAVNYANNQGAEWAVLTNGRKWYFYNAHLPKPLPEKRIFQINDLFTEEKAIEILWLLSRQAILNCTLAEKWLRDQITAIIHYQLTTPQSDVRKLLRRLSHEATKSTISDAMVADAISVFYSAQAIVLKRQYAVPTGNSEINSQPLFPSITKDLTLVSPDAQFTFDEILKDNTIGVKKRPSKLFFTDGETIEVSTWADAARDVLARLAPIYGLPPLPFSGGRKGKNFFLNTLPNHSNGNPMLHCRQVSVGEKSIFIDTNRSVGDISGCVVAYLRAVNAPLDSVKVNIQSSKK